MKYIVYPCLFCLLWFSSLAQAQSERMQKLKEKYKKQIAEVTVPVNEKYEQALINLQKKYVSENKLEEALLVKKEIEALKAGTLEPAPAPPSPTPSSPAMTRTEPTAPKPANSPGTLDWRGDQEETKDEDGAVVYTLEGVRGGTRMMTVPIPDIKKRFPNGLRFRFQYKSDGFVGEGVEMRCEFPELRGLFTYRNPTLRLDGNWNEYLWPFSDTKGEDTMNFQMLLENGEGKVSFKNFELLPN